MDVLETGLERKFCRADQVIEVKDGTLIEGYASLFGAVDRGGDIVQRGAYTNSLAALTKASRRVRMLWQHDPSEPIGVWDEVREDDKGLYVKGRLLSDVARAREAAALLEAGAIEGLSIGYRTVKATKDDGGRRRLQELELWEVSLVTFPMLPEARVGAKGDTPDDGLLRDLAAVIEDARRNLARGKTD
jgi:HK97 family phage prohead protease